MIEYSPCIDAGIPDTTGQNLPEFDLDGNPRIVNEIIDMGVYEYYGYYPPQADFSANPIEGDFPLNVSFTDLSTQGSGTITEWKWYFDDGDSSFVQNPTHLFQNAGTYTITLTVTDENDSTDTVTKIDYITVFPPQANFITDQTYGYYPSLVVNFTDLSIGDIINWSWDFQNDGTFDSFVQNPTYTYTGVGIFDVKLKVSDGIQADSLIKYDYIIVELVPPVAPTNIQIEISGDDVILNWTEVDTTIFGTPITPDGYIILHNETPYENEQFYYYLDYTIDLTYTHSYVAQYRDQMFYKVIAYVDYSRKQLKYLGALQETNKKVKWTEVKQNINAMTRME